MAVRRTMVVVVIWVVTRRDAAIGRRRVWVGRMIWIGRLVRRARLGLWDQVMAENMQNGWILDLWFVDCGATISLLA